MRKVRIFLLVVGLLVIIGGWQVYWLQQPFEEADIPIWKVQEKGDHWKVFAESEPSRETKAWLENSGDNNQCDTLIILGGLEEGKNLAVGAKHLPKQANIVALRHPINQFFSKSPWETWGAWEWLEMPSLMKNEMAHTIGALKAVTEYVNHSTNPDTRFTNRVILAGGSFGGPFPVILTSFQPDRVAALMVIYGFTNYELVISKELLRQGLIHFKLKDQYDWFEETSSSFKLLGVKLLARTLGFLLGNMLKYGYMELYFPKIYKTPVYFINGRIDRLVPKGAYDPMWESAPEPKFQVWVEGDHIRPGEPEEVRELIDHLHEWAQSENLWTCKSQ